ncbi:MAG: hypoxanthine phosphoribosyltransferase [Elusimicrobia bacterium]|nr:hypoxanthine phosphoribosyltransferase [Elusimicrobiota bacterium]
MHTDIGEVLITEEQISVRVKELAEKISKDYKGRCPVFVGVLKGCVFFLSDLLKHITIDCNVDFMCLSSYSGTQSTGIVRTVLDLKESIEDRDVVIVEDIVDSGLSMEYLLHNFRSRRPKSIKICTMLDKPAARKVNISVKYAGFEIPEKFVVGYGLDFNELYRNLPYIGVIKKSVVEKDKTCR